MKSAMDQWNTTAEDRRLHGGGQFKVKPASHLINYVFKRSVGKNVLDGNKYFVYNPIILFISLYFKISFIISLQIIRVYVI